MHSFIYDCTPQSSNLIPSHPSSHPLFGNSCSAGCRLPGWLMLMLISSSPSITFRPVSGFCSVVGWLNNLRLFFSYFVWHSHTTTPLHHHQITQTAFYRIWLCRERSRICFFFFCSSIVCRLVSIRFPGRVPLQHTSIPTGTEPEPPFYFIFFLVEGYLATTKFFQKTHFQFNIREARLCVLVFVFDFESVWIIILFS